MVWFDEAYDAEWTIDKLGIASVGVSLIDPPLPPPQNPNPSPHPMPYPVCTPFSAPSDMYRLLLAQETNKDISASSAGADGGVGGGDGGRQSGATAAAAQEAEAMKSRVHELERVSVFALVGESF